MQSTVLRNNYGINKVYLTKMLAFYNFFFEIYGKTGNFFTQIWFHLEIKLWIVISELVSREKCKTMNACHYITVHLWKFKTNENIPNTFSPQIPPCQNTMEKFLSTIYYYFWIWKVMKTVNLFDFPMNSKSTQCYKWGNFIQINFCDAISLIIHKVWY